MHVHKVMMLGDGFERLLPAWQELASTSPHKAPFFQPEWFGAFSRAYNNAERAFFVTAWSGSALRAVVPLMSTSRFFGRVPARTLRSLSGIHSCRYDAVVDGENSHESIRAIWRTLRDDSSWDVIEADDVPHGGSFFSLLGCAQEDGFLTGQWSTRKMPYLTIPAHGQNPFSNCPRDFKSLRARLKSKMRKLSEQGDVSFEVATSQYEAPFNRFLELEGAGWKGRQGSAIISDSATSSFYSQAVDYLASAGALRLYSLNVNGAAIAMQMGVAMEGVYYSPKVAYDERFASVSPGQLLNQYVISDLAKNSFHTFEFLGPRALWKCVWTSEVREHSNCYIFRPSLKGRVLQTLTMRAAASARRLRYYVRGDPQDIRRHQSV